ncbi:MAG: hypothetical protein HY747_08565, partial [Elusimicrobia bacterium]|nr:hypothetical protein [Elusimicrobiota bacterium]
AGISRTDGSHQMSLAFRFGRPKDDEADLSRLVSQEHDARVKAEKALSETQEKLDAVIKELEGLRSGAALKPEDQRLAEELEKKKRQAEEEQKRLLEEQEKARQALGEAYKLSWGLYQRKAASGAGLPDRIDLLEKVVFKYAGKGLEIGEAVQELSKLKKERQELLEEFDAAVKYYRQLADQGASSETRTELLERLIKKFEGKDVDLAPLRQDLEQLKR